MKKSRIALRVRAKENSQNLRPDFGQIGSRPIERSLRRSKNYVVGSRLRSGRRWSEDGMRKCEFVFARALGLERPRERGESSGWTSPLYFGMLFFCRIKVARFINTVTHRSRRCIPPRYVARRLNTTTVFALLAPCASGASTASVRHRIYEPNH